jgi:hypothetical protein
VYNFLTQENRFYEMLQNLSRFASLFSLTEPEAFHNLQLRGQNIILLMRELKRKQLTTTLWETRRFILLFYSMGLMGHDRRLLVAPMWQGFIPKSTRLDRGSSRRIIYHAALTRAYQGDSSSKKPHLPYL